MRGRKTTEKAAPPEPVKAPVEAAPDEPEMVEPDEVDAAPEPTPEPDRKLDETVPGGRYLVDGKLVDANGEPIKDAKRAKE